jgi:hydroxymethylpyrimidine pyrophosphatase-like HAD family hydrolase
MVAQFATAAGEISGAYFTCRNRKLHERTGGSHESRNLMAARRFFVLSRAGRKTRHLRATGRELKRKLKVNTPRLIVCDIEGCIMPPRRGPLDLPALMPLVEYCRSAQQDAALPPLVFCTGRQIPYAECVTQMLDAFFPGRPSIVENGAFLYDVAANRVLRHPLLGEQALEAMYAAREASAALLARVGTAQEFGKEICLSLNPPPSMKIETFYRVVQDELQPWSEALTITHSQSAVDITPRGIDKAAGVFFLSEQTGITPAQMLGIGDTRGDLPMLKLIGIPCGPANASREVREVSTFIAPSEGPRGVVEILERFTGWHA